MVQNLQTIWQWGRPSNTRTEVISIILSASGHG